MRIEEEYEIGRRFSYHFKVVSCLIDHLLDCYLTRNKRIEEEYEIGCLCSSHFKVFLFNRSPVGLLSTPNKRIEAPDSDQ
jgi:hypothetical protein